jgi:hypothetical protein
MQHAIKNCLRCGGAHAKVVFKTLARPAGPWTEYAHCPTTGEPMFASLDGAHNQALIHHIAMSLHPVEELPPGSGPPETIEVYGRQYRRVDEDDGLTLAQKALPPSPGQEVTP